MGSSQSQGESIAIDKKGIQDLQTGSIIINRHCIVLLTPPSFQTSKFIESKPATLAYRYISVGRMIRDEINKRTHYSKIIMENLAKDKKINERILEVLLKNVALQGNFIIQCTSDDMQFAHRISKISLQVEVEVVGIVKPDEKGDIGQLRAVFEEKLKNYEADVKNIKEIFAGDTICILDNVGAEQIWSQIIERLQKNKQAKGKVPKVQSK